MRFIPEAAFALLLAGAGLGQAATVGKVSSCNAANEAILKSQVTHASDFCEFYLAAGRTRSPLVGVNAADTIKACQCLLAASNIHTVKKPGPTRYSSSQRYVCNKQALTALQQDFAHPQNLSHVNFIEKSIHGVNQKVFDISEAHVNLDSKENINLIGQEIVLICQENIFIVNSKVVFLGSQEHIVVA
ncbi:hypothetical protein KCU98_g3053, partial [Aureobasidium melanogenum]